MSSPTVAFEAFQKAPPQENSVSTHRGACLIVARSTAGRKSAIAFLEQFEKSFTCP
jgi:hypothetical protein